MRLLVSIDSLTVAAIAGVGPEDVAAGIARRMGVEVLPDAAALFSVAGIDIVLDLTSDPIALRQAASASPAVCVISGAGVEMMASLLVANQRAAEQEKHYGELRAAYDRIRDEERRLQSGKDALERANAELESRLAEIFFTHEFFKALTSYTSVDDVTSLIVDGCNGILGAEISAVYLFDREDWALHLTASQGWPHGQFAEVIPLSSTILATAFRSGAIQQVTIEKRSDAGWLDDAVPVVSQAAVPLRSAEGPIGVLAIASSVMRELDPSEMERLQVLADQASLSVQNALLHGELERLSVTDRLTELYNHGYFRQRLDEEFKRSMRFGHGMSLIMLDIDDFKEFNDTYGHPMGDEVLRAVSSVIRCNLRDMDVAARYGGEEFVLLLPETSTAGACAVAERIRAEVEARTLDLRAGLKVGRTVSVGVASYPVDADTPMDLLETADMLMYRAKHQGKNRVVSKVADREVEV